MNFKPLGDRVLIEREEEVSKTASGIIIPDTAKEKPIRGKVIAVGDGARDNSGHLIPMNVKTGDRVIFGKWGGTEVKIGETEYLIMRESDLMGVLVDDDAKAE